MSNSNYIEQVGAYLDNELSASEVASFEAEMATNTELANEVAFQKDIIEGIKQNRIDALKSRLDGIDVSGLSGSSGSESISGVSKFAAGILLVGAAGFGLYKFMQPAEEAQTLPELEVQTEQPSDLTTESPTQSTIEDSSSNQEESQEVTANSTNKNVENQSKEADNKEQRQEGAELSTPDTESTTASPAVPEPMDVFEPGDVSENEDDLELPRANLGQSEAKVESTLEIEIVSDRKKYSFHYQVQEGKLILYGNFDAEPYEILEINVNSSTETFLYFKNNYYEIDKQNNDILPLQTIQSTKLKEELEKIRNKEP